MRALNSQKIFSDRYLTTELLKTKIKDIGLRDILVKIPLGCSSKSLKWDLPTLMHLE